MRIFMDTANIDDIRRGAALGVVDGVTTNPTLVAKEGVQYRDRIMEICEVVDGPISAECISMEYEPLVEEARRVASWHPNVVVKIPINPDLGDTPDRAFDGLKVIKSLADEGIPVNTTLLLS